MSINSEQREFLSNDEIYSLRSYAQEHNLKLVDIVPFPLTRVVELLFQGSINWDVVIVSENESAYEAVMNFLGEKKGKLTWLRKWYGRLVIL